MKTKKSLLELVKNLETLQENEQGQLKGGFAGLSSLRLLKKKDKNKDRCNNNCTVNNCYASGC